MINLIEKIKNIKMLNEVEVDSKKLLLIFIVTIGLVYVDFSYILKAQLSGVASKSSQIVKLKSDLSNLERDLLIMKDTKAKQAQVMKGPLPKVKRIISESQVSDLLQNISELANSNDVRILQIKPTRQQKASATDTKFDPGVNFSVLYIYMDLSGGYHQLGKFINDLENAQEFVIVQEIKIDSQKDNYMKQRASLTLKTYVKK